MARGEEEYEKIKCGKAKSTYLHGHFNTSRTKSLLRVRLQELQKHQSYARRRLPDDFIDAMCSFCIQYLT